MFHPLVLIVMKSKWVTKNNVIICIHAMKQRSEVNQWMITNANQVLSANSESLKSPTSRSWISSSRLLLGYARRPVSWQILQSKPASAGFAIAFWRPWVTLIQIQFFKSDLKLIQQTWLHKGVYNGKRAMRNEFAGINVNVNSLLFGRWTNWLIWYVGNSWLWLSVLRVHDYIQHQH